MPPRKARAQSETSENTVQDNPGRNGEVSEGRSLRVRKRVDYNEIPSTAKKSSSDEDSLKDTKEGKTKRQGTKTKGKKPVDNETIPDIGEGASQGQENAEDTNKFSKKSPRKTFVISEGSSKESLNTTFVVSGKHDAGKGRTKRNAEALLQIEEEQPEAKKTKEKNGKLNETNTDYSKITFNGNKTNANGEEWNLKISSWNVDGLRSWLKKDGANFLDFENPDILCLQETKCAEEKLPPEAKFEGYHSYWATGEKEGYSGVALFTKQEPMSIKYGMGIEEHDTEGRLITAEYEKFYLVTTYVPNAGKGLVTLPKRLSWNDAFQKYLKKLDSLKPVILCGDMNVSHQEIDLANPKTNTKNAGFTKEERDGMTELIAEGFVDTFRHFYPKETGAYTFWTYMRGARSRNIGWRLDYFIVSERIIDQVCDSVIRSQVLGSDHCPITLLFHNK